MSVESVNLDPNLQSVWKYQKPLEMALWIPVVQIVAYEILKSKFENIPMAKNYLHQIKARYYDANTGATTLLFLACFWNACMNRKVPKCIPSALGVAFVISLGHCIGRVWHYPKEEI